MNQGTVAILAGGRATRMQGRVKSVLEVDGERIIDRQLRVLGRVFAEVLLITDDPAPYASLGLPTFPDAIPGGLGPLAGILTALCAARSPAVVCVGCDMPFLDARALELVRDGSPGATVVAPRVGGRPEPLHARYARTIVPALRAQLAGGEYAVHHFLERTATVWIPEGDLRAIDPELRFLMNVNSPAELEALTSTPLR